MADSAEIRAAYDRWAPVYDHDANPLLALEEPAMRRAIGDPAGLSVLDLGCGTGRHSLWMAEAGAAVTAVDFSAAMMAEARRKPGGPAVRFLRHDLDQPLPFLRETFDLAVSGLVLEHLRDLDLFFHETRRVLRPGRRAVISAMHPAMFLRGIQAQFTDPSSGELIRPGSLPHSVGAFVMAAAGAGFLLDDIAEQAPDAALAARVPRAAKYVGWPMLVLLQVRTPGTREPIFAADPRG